MFDIICAILIIRSFFDRTPVSDKFSFVTFLCHTHTDVKVIKIVSTLKLIKRGKITDNADIA